MKLRRMALSVAYLFMSLAICVLGRPQPSSLPRTSSQHYPATELLEVSDEVSSRSTSSPFGLHLRLPHLHLPALNPFTQERRSLKGAGGRARGGGGGGGSFGGGGGGSTSTTLTIIIIVSTATMVLLVAGIVAWCRYKKRNPNWRFLDYFRRKKPPTAKSMTEAKSDAVADAEHKVTVDVPRLDHVTKSRKQASLHDYKLNQGSPT